MSSKTLIIIVVFGLGALVLLGMSMQFVVKSNPGLQESIKFKQALARDFSSRGVQEVALRNLHATGYQLMLTATLPDGESDRERLDEEVADYFVRTHGNKRARLLKLSYHSPPSWGCSSALAEPHRVKEIPLEPIRRRITRVQKQNVLATHLGKFGCEILSCEVEGMDIKMRVKVAVTDAGEVRNLSRRIERDTRGRLRGFYSTLRLLLLGEPAATKDENGNPVVKETILFDASFDRRGSRVKRKETRVPGAGEGSGAKARSVR